MPELGYLRASHLSRRQRLLTELHDISRLELGDVVPRPTDFCVTMLFEELYLEFAGSAASKGLRLDVDATTARVHGDPALVGEILRQLLSNAITFTQAGGVRLRCRADGSHAHLEVHDTGIGIPADQLRRIYDPFYQLSTKERTGEGYGLGLSIVQRLVRLTGVELDVRSEVGRGSVFSLVLPSCAA